MSNDATGGRIGSERGGGCCATRCNGGPVPADRNVPEGWHIEVGMCMHYDPTESHLRPRLVEDVPLCRDHRNIREEDWRQESIRRDQEDAARQMRRPQVVQVEDEPAGGAGAAAAPPVAPATCPHGVLLRVRCEECVRPRSASTEGDGT